MILTCCLDLPSMHDEFIRHRLSDLSVSQQQHKLPSPLEPNSQQPFYSRRASVTDPSGFNNFRRPSITDLNNLPLPNSTVVSRRGSIATDYDYSSRSPSPSPYTFPSKRGHHDDFGRRDSLPLHQLPIPPNKAVYDPYQRRHSIATADHQYQRNPAKYRGKEEWDLDLLLLIIQ